MVERKILIPEENFDSLITFFHLEEREIAILGEVVQSDDIKTIEDFCVNVINKLEKTDKEATEIFLAYSFLVANITRSEIPFTEVCNNIIDAGKKVKNKAVVEAISQALETKSTAFETLFTIDSSETEASKRSWLASKIGNAVMATSVICDLRPLFDKTRSEIKEIIPIYILEFVVTDVTGNSEVICVNLNESMFEELNKKLELGDQKMKIMKSKMGALKGELNG